MNALITIVIPSPWIHGLGLLAVKGAKPMCIWRSLMVKIDRFLVQQLIDITEFYLCSPGAWKPWSARER